MSRLHNTVCPTCHADVSVTYWPYGVPLYTVHFVRGSNRECGCSLRPVVEVRPAADRPAADVKNPVRPH